MTGRNPFSVTTSRPRRTEGEGQQHEVALEVGEARAARLGGALHVDEVEGDAEVEVVLGLEVEGRRLADAAQLDRVLLAADRDVVHDEVGDVEEHLAHARLDGLELLLACLDRVAERAHGGDRLAGVAARLLDRGDLVRGGLALGAHGLDLGGEPAALGLDGEELVERLGAAAALRAPRARSRGWSGPA